MQIVHFEIRKDRTFEKVKAEESKEETLDSREKSMDNKKRGD